MGLVKTGTESFVNLSSAFIRKHVYEIKERRTFGS